LGPPGHVWCSFASLYVYKPKKKSEGCLTFWKKQASPEADQLEVETLGHYPSKAFR
jgi:hypothetical protein